MNTSLLATSQLQEGSHTAQSSVLAIGQLQEGSHTGILWLDVLLEYIWNIKNSFIVMIYST